MLDRKPILWWNYSNTGRGGPGSVSVRAGSEDEANARLDKWLGWDHSRATCECCGPDYVCTGSTNEPEHDRQLKVVAAE